MESSLPEQSKVQIRLTTRHADIELPEDPGVLFVPTSEHPPKTRQIN
jgi:hypothetical protein